jgi:hypothetical protein
VDSGSFILSYPLELPVNLWITSTPCQDFVLLVHCVLSVSLPSYCHFHGEKFHRLRHCASKLLSENSS